MKSNAAILGFACVIASIPGSASDADFTLVTVEYKVMPGCARTFRFYANFNNQEDQLLAVNGNSDKPLRFYSSDPLYNDGGLISGFAEEDTAMAPITGPQDSWVTIDSEGFLGNDTMFTPGFAGGDGIHAVVVGTYFEDDSGGWIDSDVTTPATGNKILIAQFSLEADSTDLVVQPEGNVTWKQPEHENPIQSEFGPLAWEIGNICTFDLDLSGTWGGVDVDVDDLLIVLANWGPCPVDCCLADFNADGEIGLEDLLMLLSRWGHC